MEKYIWQQHIANDVWVQQGLYTALFDVKNQCIEDDVWKGWQMKIASIIQFTLTQEIRCKTSLAELESLFYMSAPLTNRFYLKKELFALKMQKGVGSLQFT